MSELLTCYCQLVTVRVLGLLITPSLQCHQQRHLQKENLQKLRQQLHKIKIPISDYGFQSRSGIWQCYVADTSQWHILAEERWDAKRWANFATRCWNASEMGLTWEDGEAETEDVVSGNPSTAVSHLITALWHPCNPNLWCPTHLHWQAMQPASRTSSC